MGFLKRPDAKNTIIVLRSDHGLQGGPAPIDYSAQIEHMNPWNNIIIPKHLIGNIQHLSSNQLKLVTGFDLYRTLKECILFNKHGIPEWSYNLFTNTIPEYRSCEDARIPTQFCPCIHERKDMMPYYYVGYAENNATQKPNCNPELINDKKIWAEIDNISKEFPRDQVSGGIFLYPRQEAFISYVIQREIMQKNQNETFRVCETGFGAGHSASLFLSIHPNIQVFTFDKFNRLYQKPIVQKLKSLYGTHRLQTFEGDSCSTLPLFLKTDKHGCDFLHGSSLCPTDNIDLVQYSKPGITLTSTAMHSLLDNQVYFGLDAQWRTLLKKQCIQNIKCFKERPTKFSRFYRFNTDTTTNVTRTSRFCFATITGICYYKRNAVKQVQDNSHYDLVQGHPYDFCPEAQVSIHDTYSSLEDYYEVSSSNDGIITYEKCFEMKPIIKPSPAPLPSIKKTHKIYNEVQLLIWRITGNAIPANKLPRPIQKSHYNLAELRIRALKKAGKKNLSKSEMNYLLKYRNEIFSSHKIICNEQSGLCKYFLATKKPDKTGNKLME